jgi:pimeloyl-ACP methyl ester carboxylesterase
MARSQVEFEMSRGARPLLAAGLALALTACAGARLPPPQASAAVPALWVDCRGEPSGGPTVVLEAGAFGTSADWDEVLTDLAGSGRVCAYDRAGEGASPPGPAPRDAEKIARELAATLDRLGETGPVVLAGHSNGGVYAEAFAILFPQRTAGVLYINAVGTDDLDSPLVMSELRDEEQRARLAVIGGRLGLAGMVAPRLIAEMGLPPGAARQKFLALTSDHHRLNSREEVLQIIPSLRRIRALGNVSPAIPTVAIVSTWPPETPAGAAWRAAETAPARRACQGWALVAPGGTHVSPLGRDRAYALAAVRWLQTPGLKTDPVCTGPQFRG